MGSDYDLYSDTYYESLNGTFRNITNLPEPVKSYGSANTFIRGCLVLLLRVGFVLIQLGSVPIENVYIILLQNIVDIAVSVTSFGIIGYILAFGYDTFDGIIGQGMWLASDDVNFDNAVLGFSACLMATGIITMILSGRIHFIGYVLTNIFFSTIMQPIIMHWVWHDYGWMRQRIFMNHKVSVKDHAGGLVIHVTAGTAGLIGALFLGRRLLKLSDIDDSSIGTESPGSTFTGYIFVALGLIGFSLPLPSYEVTHIPYNYIGLILINNIMALAAGIVMMVILQFLFSSEAFNYWMILRCMQGAIAGMVSIASGVDVYKPIYAFAIASISAVLFYFIVLCMHNSSVEDYCNVTAIHLICGLVSSILPPILGSSENLGVSVTAHFRVIHLGWQLLCLLTITGSLLIVFTTVFLILFLTGFLRNKSEEVNHRRGVTVAVQGPERCFLQRLFVLHSDTPYIEPGKHGKSPEQYYAFRKEDACLTEIKNIRYSSKHATQPTESSKATKNQEVFNVMLTNSNELPKKSRYVYTIPSITSTLLPDHFKPKSFDSFKSSGDMISQKLGPSIYKPEMEKFCKKSCDIGDLFERRQSCYELHRTEKHTNLLQNKYSTRKVEILYDVLKNDLPQNLKSIAHDSLYNDNFVTIKMPSAAAIDELSDTSDG